MVAEQSPKLRPSQPTFDRAVVELTVSDIVESSPSWAPDKVQWKVTLSNQPWGSNQFPTTVYATKIKGEDIPLHINPGQDETVRCIVERQTLQKVKATGEYKDATKPYNYKYDIIDWGTDLPLTPTDGQNFMADALLASVNNTQGNAPAYFPESQLSTLSMPPIAPPPNDIDRYAPDSEVIEPDPPSRFSPYADLNTLDQLPQAESNKMMTASTAFKGAVEMVLKHIDLYPITRPEGMEEKEYQQYIQRFAISMTKGYTDAFRNILYNIEGDE